MRNYEKKQIDLGGRTVAYTLRVSKRARNLRLTIRGDGNLVATLPRGMHERFAARFIAKKSRWVIDTLDRFKKFPAGNFTKGSRRDFLAHKERARALAEERLAYFSPLCGLSYHRISIRNQKTRWGSCSRKGNLNFNYKIALLPSRLSDYIIVHELCHLKELNHSEKFWNLVAAVIPEHRAIRTELRKCGGYV